MTPHCSPRGTIHKNSLSIIFGLLGVISFFFIAPSTALAVDVVTGWTLPGSNQNYEFTDNVVLTGEWLLPPDWIGNIYIYQDGVQMHDALHPGANCNLAPAPAGCYIAINNIGGVTSLPGSFSFDIGPQPDGIHNLQIKFWGGAFCAVKAELNSMTPPPSPLYTDTCTPDEDNFNAGQIYPLRSYTVNQPKFPRIAVTPVGNPALDFANVTTGGQIIKNFTVTNTGQQSLTFTMSGLSAPYYCYGGSCTQTVAMNQSKIVQIQFVPEVVGTYPATVVFTCTGAPLACDVPSITRTITGNAIGADLPPKVSIVAGAPLNFGSFYLYNPPYKDANITIKNTGGGLLNGFITTPTGEYVCIGGCNYSLFAGDSVTKTIRFTPDHADLNRNDIATLSDSGAGATTIFKSIVSDTPVLDACVLNCLNPWNAGNKVNIGEHREIGVYVRNIGGGNLSGVITGLPDRGFSFTPNASYPYTNITPAMSWVLVGKFNFDPSDALPASAVAYFSNDNPVGGNTDSINLIGQGNDQPVLNGGAALSVLFGPVVLNTPKIATLTVTNTGVGVLNVNIPFGALTDPAFSCVLKCVLALGAGASDTITFSFTPTAKIGYSTVVNVGGTSVTLSGSGIKPAESIYAQDYNGTWHQLPYGAPIEYGNTSYGSPVQDKLLTVQFQSTGGPGTRMNYSIDTSAAPHFQCTANCSGTVSVDAPFWWWGNSNIVFKPGNAPSGPGDYTETITINYDFNDGVSKQYTYQAHGTSVAAPYMTVTPTSYSWPPTVVGNTPTKVFTVKNEGIGPLSGSINIPFTGGLVGLWTFDNADMDWVNKKAFDSSGNGNTGTLISGPTASLGYFGDALHIVPNQYVDLGAVSPAFNFSGDITGVAWIKTSTNGRMIFDYQNGNPLIYMSVGATTAGGAANKFVVYLRTNGGGVAVFSSNKTVTDGVWHQVAFVRSAVTGKVKLFIDGALDSTFAYADGGSINTSGGGHYIGGAGGSFFSGDIDDVRMYSRALGTAEIAKLYQGQVVVYDPIFKCIDPSPCVFNNLAPGDTQPVTFSFAPADAFTYTATPLFSSDGGNINVSLLGTGVYQPFIVITPDTIIDPSAYVGPYNFLDVGTSNLGAYVEKNIRLWNVGHGPLDGTITFTSGVHFSCQPAATGCSFSIPEGMYKDVTIRFAPLAVGGLDDVAKFNSNAFNGLQTVQVHGVGIFRSIINILGSGQNFPPTVIGRWKEQNIIIKNTGTVDFGTGVFSISHPFFTCTASSAGPLIGGLCPYNLAAGGTTVITVRFAPTAVGQVQGLVSLSTLSLANFFVSGTGVSPSVKFIEQ